jgi:hypothetical protein
VSADTSVTITLVASVTLTGKVLDPLGNGLPNQCVFLAAAGTTNWIKSTTDASGNYAFQVSPGNYDLKVQTSNNSPSLNAPRVYWLDTSYSNSKLSLTQSTIMNITLPAKKVSVHVQDPAGNPVANVGITTNNFFNFNLTLGTLRVMGRSEYPSLYPPATTNASGDTTLWLFPTPTDQTYTFTATPPPGLSFLTFNVHDTTVTSDLTVVVVLQFVHAPPVTTVTTAPPANPQGEYTDQVTVTLSATAYTGFTIQATYYTIDGGAKQTYSAPFAVSGLGTHSVK